MSWIILRCAFRKEPYVVEALRRHGYEAWHPVQIVACRPAIARRVSSKAQLRTYREIAILPKLVFVGGPDLFDREVQSELRTLRHVECLETDSEQRVVQIPAAQIAAFRATIDAENTASLALAQKASRRQRARWKNLKDALLELVDSAKQQMEQAA